MTRFTTFLAAACLVAGAARAQVPPGPAGTPPELTPEMAGMMQLAARNQLGVLEYCQAHGAIDADTVQLQRRQIAAMPRMAVPGLDQAEAAGRQGIVQAGGQGVSLEQAAQSQGTTVAALCEQVGGMLRAQENEADETPPRP